MDKVALVLSPRVPELSALELLLTVAREGSFGAAAVVHRISQPAVSARIRSMERLLGFAVVDRGARGSTLTPRGALVAEWAQVVVDAAAALDAGIGSLRSDVQATLRLAASLTIAEHLLPIWLARWRTRQPGVAISLTGVNSAEAARRVSEGEADLGFLEGPVVPRGLASRTVAADRLVVVCAPGHPWARRRAVALDVLAATPLVTREAGSGTRVAFESAVAAATERRFQPPLPALELSTTSAVRLAAGTGAGPAVISDLAARDDLASGRLVEVHVAGLDLARKLRAVWPRGQRPSGAARDLLDLIAHSSRPSGARMV